MYRANLPYPSYESFGAAEAYVLAILDDSEQHWGGFRLKNFEGTSMSDRRLYLNYAVIKALLSRGTIKLISAGTKHPVRMS